MAILRNIQIAKKYNITPATVGNWIEQAKNKKINLELTSVNGRFYIEDSEHNHLEIERLKKQGVKFRSKQNGVTRVEVNPKLYEVFTEDQIINLFMSISYYNYIPTKFSYIGDGVKYFEEGFATSISIPNSKQSKELNLIQKYFENISERVLSENLSLDKKLNIVELGADDSTYAFVEGVKSLHENDFINKYISVGISEDMARIRQNNIKRHIDIPTSKYIFDIEENVLRGILFKEKDNDKSINLCTLLFSSLSNIKNLPALLSNLVESLSPNDYLLISTVLTNDSRDIKSNTGNIQNLVKRHSWLLSLLGLSEYINIEYYKYDAELKLKSNYLTLNRDIDLVFVISGKEYVLSLKRDQRITFFVSYRYTISELQNFFSNAGFIVDQYNCDREQNFGLFLLRVGNINLVSGP